MDDTTRQDDLGPEEDNRASEGAMDYAARRAELRSQRRRDRSLARLWRRYWERPVWQRAVIGVPSVLLALVLVGAVIDTASSLGRVHPGVSVAGVAVGGMTQDGAQEKLEAEMRQRMTEPVAVVFEEESWSLEASAVVAAPDTAAMLSSAMAVGRTGSFGDRLSERAKAWFGGVDVEPVVTADADLLQSAIAVINEQVGRDPVNATVVIEDTSARVEPSEVGVAVRGEELTRDLLAAFASQERQVSVGVEFVPVEITDEEAEVAKKTAELMMSGPVTVVHDKESWEFPPEDIAKWIEFRMVAAEEATAAVTEEATESGGPSSAAAPDSSAEGTAGATPEMVLEAYIEAENASETITPRVGEAGRPAKDASFRVGGGHVTIIPSQDGVGPDIESLAKEMTLVLSGDGDRTVELRTRRVKPDITTEDAEDMGIVERISTYTTTYDPSNKPRVNNIHTLAGALDGTLVAPGGVFSFNETVGPRTAAKGYQEAPAIVNGKLVPQLGGGICQVGTTIFNTVFESGLPVVERRNHSFYISHYPKGRDATVSWGGPDFKFRNDTEHWVLVATAYSNSSLTISIYGTDPGYEVAQEVGSWTNVKEHPVEEIEDDTMPEGSRVVEDGGVDGRNIVVTRIVTKNGVEVRRDTFASVYKPKTEVVRVGTKKVDKSQGTTATP